MKNVLSIYDAPAPHWVGDGFPVRSLFSYNSGAELLSPFLLLDYAGPRSFEPSETPRGVGEHPHRGFETVTIVYQGEVAHRDSSGGGGEIGPGDVQWMTAGSGILHDEFHSELFTRRGGQVAIFDRAGKDFSIEAKEDAKLLLLGDRPLNQPIVGYAPYVMTSQGQIREAIDDFNSGRFGGHA